MPADSRVVALNDKPLRSDGEYVLYWQIMARRTTCNFALERAIGHARHLSKPLVVLEPLRISYRWASDRLHQFCIDGMSDNAAAYEKAGVAYHPYVEHAEGDGKGLLATLAKPACIVITDDYPEFFLPRMLNAAGSALDRIGVRLEAVDSNGLLPVRAVDKPYVYAHQFRRALQQRLPEQLGEFPSQRPLKEARYLPRPNSAAKKILEDVQEKWPRVRVEEEKKQPD